MKINKLLLSMFVSLITFILLPNISAVDNSEIIYKSDVIDFSDCGINLAERSGEFKEISIANMQVGDVFVDADETAKKIVSISRTKKKIIINTQTPDFYDAIESYKLPEQNIKIDIGEELANSRATKNIFSRDFAVRKGYSNNVGKVSFEATLNAALNLNAKIDIPVKNKEGMAEVGSSFEIGVKSAKVEAGISQKYSSNKIELVNIDKKNSVLKINTKIVTQTIATGKINAQFSLFGKVSGGVTFFAILERRFLKLPLPTKCGVRREFGVDMAENLTVSIEKPINLEQLLGIEFGLSVIGIRLADVSSYVEPYFRADGNIDTSMSFNVDRNFKITSTPPKNVFDAECEFGINMNTSLCLLKNLYKKDFGEKNLVVYRYSGKR